MHTFFLTEQTKIVTFPSRASTGELYKLFVEHKLTHFTSPEVNEFN